MVVPFAGQKTPRMPKQARHVGYPIRRRSQLDKEKKAFTVGFRGKTFKRPGRVLALRFFALKTPRYPMHLSILTPTKGGKNQYKALYVIKLAPRRVKKGVNTVSSIF